MGKSEHLKQYFQKHSIAPELKIEKHQRNIYRNASSYLETKKQKTMLSVMR